jgi:hypothetical protein
VAKDPHPRGELDWASASVKDGELSVDVAGTPNAEWARGLEAIVERLHRPGSGWGEVKVAKATLRVASVSPGSEADLRHVLDSAVLQVNTNFAPGEEGEAGNDDDGRSPEDREMTDAFRSFSTDPDGPEQEEDQPSA